MHEQDIAKLMKVL